MKARVPYLAGLARVGGLARPDAGQPMLRPPRPLFTGSDFVAEFSPLTDQWPDAGQPSGARATHGTDSGRSRPGVITPAAAGDDDVTQAAEQHGPRPANVAASAGGPHSAATPVGPGDLGQASAPAAPAVLPAIPVGPASRPPQHPPRPPVLLVPPEPAPPTDAAVPGGADAASPGTASPQPARPGSPPAQDTPGSRAGAGAEPSPARPLLVTSWADPVWALPIELPGSDARGAGQAGGPAPTSATGTSQASSPAAHAAEAILQPAAAPALGPTHGTRPGQSDASSPRVSIGTIEVTIVAPPAQQPAPGAPALPGRQQEHTAPTWSRPPSLLTASRRSDRLRSGLRRWHGTAQG
jgi:hypothetical protein